MVLQTFQSKGRRPLLWVGSLAAREKILIIGIPKSLNYCVIFVVYMQFTKAAAGRIIQRGVPRFEDTCFKRNKIKTSP
jgi:hypothetical protein